MATCQSQSKNGMPPDEPTVIVASGAERRRTNVTTWGQSRIIAIRPPSARRNHHDLGADRSPSEHGIPGLRRQPSQEFTPTKMWG